MSVSAHSVSGGVHVLPDKSPPRAAWNSSCRGPLAVWRLPAPAAWTTSQRWGRSRSESPPPESDQNPETCQNSAHLIPFFPPCCLSQVSTEKDFTYTNKEKREINTSKYKHVYFKLLSLWNIPNILTCQSWLPSCGQCGCKCLAGTGWEHSWLTPLSCLPSGEKLAQNSCVLTVKDIFFLLSSILSWYKWKKE